jgi:hypothetical protein
MVYLLREIKVYDERADGYSDSFRKFISERGCILDVGSGVFSKSLL